MSNPCIIVLGNLSDGFQFFGPFEDFDVADDYARQNMDGDNWIATLYPPDPMVMIAIEEKYTNG